MNKLTATLTFALALSVPSFASPRSECLKQTVVSMRADLEACKDLKDKLKDNCRKEASNKAKAGRAACPAAEKPAPSKATVKTTVTPADTASNSKK